MIRIALIITKIKKNSNKKNIINCDIKHFDLLLAKVQKPLLF